MIIPGHFFKPCDPWPCQNDLDSTNYIWTIYFIIACVELGFPLFLNNIFIHTCQNRGGRLSHFLRQRHLKFVTETCVEIKEFTPSLWALHFSKSCFVHLSISLVSSSYQLTAQQSLVRCEVNLDEWLAPYKVWKADRDVSSHFQMCSFLSQGSNLQTITGHYWMFSLRNKL